MYSFFNKLKNSCLNVWAVKNYKNLSSLLLKKNLADDRYNCPNNGLPKLDESGKSIQCLPGMIIKKSNNIFKNYALGQPSDIVCGKGYSCFFSGFNYQCCPTSIEDELNDKKQTIINECPQDSFAVLSANGHLIKCNVKDGIKCPQVNLLQFFFLITF